MRDRIIDLKINQFRGIKNLELNKCNNINIILGDNNSGKTSILEAIYLTRSNEVYDVIDLIRNRISTTSINHFTYLFHTGTNSIDISLKLENNSVDYSIEYEKNKVLFNKEMFLSDYSEDENNYFSSLIDLYDKSINGEEQEKINGSINYNGEINQFEFLNLDLFLGKIVKKKDDLLKIRYLNSFKHFTSSDSSIISNILKNDNMHKLFIRLIKIFDENIEDVVIIVDDLNNNSLYVKRKDENPMPLYLYGDGFKKAIYLTCELINASNGILLIDEIETSLSYKYLPNIFEFIIRVSEVINTQIFLTTHNKETVYSLLKKGKDLNKEGNMNIYTIRHKNDKTYSRLLKGKEAYDFVYLRGNEVRV